MKIIVKRINYKRVDGSKASYYYIYKQWREGRKIKTKYIRRTRRHRQFLLNLSYILGKFMVRGVGFEPTQAYASGS